MNSHYTIVIQWAEEDQCYVVSFPKWSDYRHTHGDTDEEALTVYLSRFKTRCATSF